MSRWSLFSNVTLKYPTTNQIFVRPDEDMTSHVPHLDLVILNFKAQTLEIFNNEGPLTISKKLFTVSVSR